MAAFELDLQSPVISMVAKSYSHIQGSDKLKGYPKSLIIAKLGSEAALDRAMARGDVKCVNERGRQFYVFNMIEIAKVQGAEQQTQGTLSAHADSGQLAGFTSFVENFQPTFQDNAVGFGGDFGENSLASTSSMVPHVPETPGVGGRLLMDLGGAVPPPPPGPLAICDKAAEVPQALDKSVLSKIDDGLNWWKSLREQARKSLEKAQGPACAALKQQMQQKLKDMFAWQTQLEEMKMFGTAGNSQNVKALLSNFASGLVQIQESIRGLQTMA